MFDILFHYSLLYTMYDGGIKKKSPKMYDSINELKPNTTPVIQGPSSDSSLSGTEVVFNHSC